MANGYCTPILQHIEAVAGTNPAKKLSPLGFTQMLLCCQDGSVTPLNDGYQAGHQRTVNVKYRKRPLESSVSSTPNACDVAVTPSYSEFTIPNLIHRSYSVYIPDTLIRQYCKEASEFVKLDSNGNSVMSKQSSVMQEVYDMLIEGGGALLKSMNKALVTQMSTAFGKNVQTGATTAKEIEFKLGTTGMQDALIQLISDWRENEFCDDVCMVGSGDFANFDLIKQIMGGINAQGIDQARLANLIPKVWFDKDARAIWGDSNVGVFEKGSLALITRNMYEGNFARPLANSNFFSMALPVNEYNCPQECLDKLIFDVQVREIDCPTEMTINGTANTTVEKGVQIVLSKNFALFTKPTNLYENADELYGTNGTLRYKITATPDCPCPEVAEG